MISIWQSYSGKGRKPPAFRMLQFDTHYVDTAYCSVLTTKILD